MYEILNRCKEANIIQDLLGKLLIHHIIVVGQTQDIGVNKRIAAMEVTINHFLQDEIFLILQ